MKGRKWGKWVWIRLTKLFSPAAVLRKVSGLAARVRRQRKVSLPVMYDSATTGEQECPAVGATPSGKAGVIPPLNLKVGERVRVKTLEQVYATLDASERYEGCTFTGAMVPYCGKEFVVLNRIERFYDERNGKLLRGKNMVILEGVQCRTSPESLSAYAGCDRRCYLFWKEAWLERLPAEEKRAD